VKEVRQGAGKNPHWIFPLQRTIEYRFGTGDGTVHISPHGFTAHIPNHVAIFATLADFATANGNIPGAICPAYSSCLSHQTICL
jgi:hypothetical protein